MEEITLATITNTINVEIVEVLVVGIVLLLVLVVANNKLIY